MRKTFEKQFKTINEKEQRTRAIGTHASLEKNKHTQNFAKREEKTHNPNSISSSITYTERYWMCTYCWQHGWSIWGWNCDQQTTKQISSISAFDISLNQNLTVLPNFRFELLLPLWFLSMMNQRNACEFCRFWLYYRFACKKEMCMPAFGR